MDKTVSSIVKNLLRGRSYITNTNADREHHDPTYAFFDVDLTPKRNNRPKLPFPYDNPDLIIPRTTATPKEQAVGDDGAPHSQQQSSKQIKKSKTNARSYSNAASLVNDGPKITTQPLPPPSVSLPILQMDVEMDMDVEIPGTMPQDKEPEPANIDLEIDARPLTPPPTVTITGSSLLKNTVPQSTEEIEAREAAMLRDYEERARKRAEEGRIAAELAEAERLRELEIRKAERRKKIEDIVTKAVTDRVIQQALIIVDTSMRAAAGDETTKAVESLMAAARKEPTIVKTKEEDKPLVVQSAVKPETVVPISLGELRPVLKALPIRISTQGMAKVNAGEVIQLPTALLRLGISSPVKFSLGTDLVVASIPEVKPVDEASHENEEMDDADGDFDLGPWCVDNDSGKGMHKKKTRHIISLSHRALISRVKRWIHSETMKRAFEEQVARQAQEMIKKQEEERLKAEAEALAQAQAAVSATNVAIGTKREIEENDSESMHDVDVTEQVEVKVVRNIKPKIKRHKPVSPAAAEPLTSPDIKAEASDDEMDVVDVVRTPSPDQLLTEPVSDAVNLTGQLDNCVFNKDVLRLRAMFDDSVKLMYPNLFSGVLTQYLRVYVPSRSNDDLIGTVSMKLLVTCTKLIAELLLHVIIMMGVFMMMIGVEFNENHCRH